MDETTDTRDTIDWLLKNVPNNSGKVGVLGISYPGFLAIMAGIDAHPAVKAISPQAPMTDVWMGDDFFHNGAFRETYGFDYVQQLEAQKTDGVVDSKEDQYNYFLEPRELCRSGRGRGHGEPADGEGLPHAAELQQVLAGHGGRRAFDQGGGADARGRRVVGPGGYVGTAGGVCRAEAARCAAEVFLVLGPWNHGGWVPTTTASGRARLRRRDRRAVPQARGAVLRTLSQGSGAASISRMWPSFRTGVNQWERYDAWPPKTRLPQPRSSI